MRIGTAAFAALVGLCLAGGADAQTRRQPLSPSYVYAFGEFDHYSASGGSLNGGGLGAGWRFHRYFAIQGGGQYARKSGVDFTNGYAEMLAILPLGPRFSLNASLGGSFAEASTSARIGPTTFTVSTNGSGYRAGLGAEYWLTPRWGLRAGFHRQNALGVADDFGVGIALRF